VSFSINPFTMAGATYAVSDFTPIAMMGKLPFSLMVGKSVPANNIRELIALIKAKPGEYNGGQGGIAGTTYFLLEAFKKAADVDVASISYKGTTETVVDLLAGRLQLMFAPVTTALPYHGGGEVKVFGVSGSERTPLMPDVPTFTELGFPSLDISTWFGLIGPKGVPAADVDILSGAVAKALVSQDVRESLLKNGITASYGTPAELEKFLQADMARWNELAKASGIKPQ
jgi:tripartite-type tricarboxylate transporter receptor subunit TctC